MNNVRRSLPIIMLASSLLLGSQAWAHDHKESPKASPTATENCAKQAKLKTAGKAIPCTAEKMKGMDHSNMNMDHGSMDMSKMDHSKMDMSNMDHSKMDMSNMKMPANTTNK